ncbi:ABC transporter substrate-binding protein [Streptacidiphilus sp. P02-A3a]|uniref:ABC transporter substrate-binding protein n=1 Tax=Streptacidiphilus sp. P02-A3a TaxID=2704468 RepID=UPI0015F7B6FB|nr:extracellular solute-binding protein [Streptacidiphilus sp. P02-A3a]QMU71083.1 extracellular solute-binding protein [Streptacidiphilus sp. P02-A3a]
MSLQTAVSAGRRAALALATTALVAGLASGCGSTAKASTSTAATASGPVPLVVYSAQGYDSAMATAFQKATGIPTKLVDDSTGPLLAKVQAERGNPQWGVLWVDGDEAFAAMDQAGMLVKGFEPDVQLSAAGQAVVPGDKSYIPTGLTVTAAVVYDASKTPNPPTSWQQLLSPAWKGEVGMNDPSVSGPTYPFVAGMFSQLGGNSQGEAFYTGLKSNGLHVFQTNDDTLHALQTGQIKVALIQSSAGLAAGTKNHDIRTAYLPKVTSLPSVIGIDAKVSAKERSEAEQFASFVLSAQGQHVMLTGDPNGDSLYWPIVQGVDPQAALPPLASVPTQAIDPYTWGPQEGTINTWFTNTIVH